MGVTTGSNKYISNLPVPVNLLAFAERKRRYADEPPPVAAPTNADLPHNLPYLYVAGLNPAYQFPINPTLKTEVTATNLPVPVAIGGY